MLFLLIKQIHTLFNHLIFTETAGICNFFVIFASNNDPLKIQHIG